MRRCCVLLNINRNDWGCFRPCGRLRCLRCLRTYTSTCAYTCTCTCTCASFYSYLTAVPISDSTSCIRLSRNDAIGTQHVQGFVDALRCKSQAKVLV